MTAIWQCSWQFPSSLQDTSGRFSVIGHLRAFEIHTQAGYEDWPRYVLIGWSKWFEGKRLIIEYAALRLEHKGLSVVLWNENMQFWQSPQSVSHLTLLCYAPIMMAYLTLFGCFLYNQVQIH